MTTDAANSIAATTHVVRRHVLELRVAGQDGVPGLQDDVHRVVHERLVPAMDRILSRHSPAGEVIRLDRLELDLGRLFRANLATQLVARTEDELEKALARELAALRQPPGGERTIGRVLTAEAARLDALRLFLETGRLPWWAPSPPDGDPEAMLGALLESAPGDVVRMLRTIPTSTATVMAKRIVKQFAPETRRRLLDALAAEQTPEDETRGAETGEAQTGEAQTRGAETHVRAVIDDWERLLDDAPADLFGGELLQPARGTRRRQEQTSKGGSPQAVPPRPEGTTASSAGFPLSSVDPPSGTRRGGDRTEKRTVPWEQRVPPDFVDRLLLRAVASGAEPTAAADVAACLVEDLAEAGGETADGVVSILATHARRVLPPRSEVRLELERLELVEDHRAREIPPRDIEDAPPRMAKRAEDRHARETPRPTSSAKSPQPPFPKGGREDSSLTLRAPRGPEKGGTASPPLGKEGPGGGFPRAGRLSLVSKGGPRPSGEPQAGTPAPEAPDQERRTISEDAQDAATKLRVPDEGAPPTSRGPEPEVERTPRAPLTPERARPERAPVRRFSETRGRLAPDEALFVDDAGLVLVAPYLPAYLGKVGLVAESAFVSLEAQERAVLLLRYLATKTTAAGEHLLALHKLLCGWLLDEPVVREIEPTPAEKEESTDLLSSIIHNWKVLKRTSVDGLRASFLAREGRLTDGDQGWKLVVQRAGHDVLLDHLPWGIGLVLLPWMDRPLFVEW